MLLTRRLGVVLVCAGVLTVAGLLLMRSHARATIKYAHLTPIKKRIISQTLASARPGAAPINNEGAGPDGAPTTQPSRINGRESAGSLGNYFARPV